MPRRTLRRWTPQVACSMLGVIVLMLGYGCPPRGPDADLPTVALVQLAAPTSVGRFQRFEVTVSLWHPDREKQDVLVQGRFVSPSRKVTVVPGFARERDFAVRFAPREVGQHSYVVEADVGAGMKKVAEGKLTVVSSPLPGYVHVDPEHPHQFLREDGKRLFLLGENRFNVYDPSWNYEQADIEPYLASMAEHGENAIRLFVFTDCENEQRPKHDQLGCLEPSLGHFDEGAAHDYDRIFEAAERYGIYVVMTVFAVGFTPGDVWKSWEDNPYSSARGGPARTPVEFFERPEARAAALSRLRYVLARYAYSTSLLAIDLLNEPEWDGEIPEETWIPWARELAREWHARDPYGHLVTVGSVGLHWNLGGDERPWYGDPQNDFIEWHLYGKETYEPHALAREMTRKTRETWGYDKPVMVGEFGYGGEDKQTFDHTHVGIYSATFSGASVLVHSAPVFEIDSDEPMLPERAAHLRALRSLLNALEPSRELSPIAEGLIQAEPKGVLTWALGDSQRRAVWLLAPEQGYGQPVDNARITLSDMPCVPLRATFWDDTRGEPLPNAPSVELSPARERTGERCRVTMYVPSFVRHLAAIVDPLPQTNAPTSALTRKKSRARP